MQYRKRNTLSRLAFVGLASLAGLTSLPAQSQSPTTQIVVPYAPGGSTDILGRILAQKLAGATGASFIVENKPGAGTAIGATYVARSTADGHTLLMATSTTLAINSWLYKKLSYDPVKDFTPVAQVAEVPLAVVVHPSVQAKTLAELVELARSSESAPMNYASAGNGSPHHLVAEMFKSAANVKLTHIAYKGSAPAITDVVAGHVPLMFADIAPILPFLESGRLKVLAVTSSQRVSALPNVPTVAESGIPGMKNFEGVAWQGLVAPAGTPAPVIDKLSREIVKIMAQPDVKTKLENDGLVVRTRAAGEFAQYIAMDLPRWGDAVKASGATLD